MYKVIDITSNHIAFTGTKKECKDYMKNHYDRFYRMYFIQD